MGLISKILGKKTIKEEHGSETTLKEDILSASDWIVNALNSSGYNADYSLDSMKEIDRFFDEQNTPTGILSRNRGQILFGLGSYVGQTAIKLYGGEWITDDEDPEGEINISVKLSNGSTICPVIRCMKRYELGSEESIYAYLAVMDKTRTKELKFD